MLTFENVCQGAQSAFAPYIELLPAVHHGVPMFWSGDTLSQLQYPPLVEQVKKRRFLRLQSRLRMCMSRLCERLHS